jgi:hypothetical protein
MMLSLVVASRRERPREVAIVVEGWQSGKGPGARKLAVLSANRWDDVAVSFAMPAIPMQPTHTTDDLCNRHV